MGAYPEFARLLNHYLTSHERSLNWTASKLGCNTSTVQRWVTLDTRPRDQRMITKILDLFGIENVQERAALFVAAGYPAPKQDTLPASDLTLNEAMNAPAQPHDFIVRSDDWVGRSDLVAELHLRLRTSCRLLLLSGMTGIGKTALAEHLSLALTSWSQPRGCVTRLNFDNQERRTDFAGVALQWLREWGEVVAQDEQHVPDLLLRRLLQNLGKQRHLIVIDALEKRINRSHDNHYAELLDEWWTRFFRAILSAERLAGRVIVTTQVLPEQVLRFASEYDNRFAHVTLTGLSIAEQEEFFAKGGLNQSGNEEVSICLIRIGQAYAGHPLALRAISGEIKGRFGGDVLAYWRQYGDEFAKVEEEMGTHPSDEESELAGWRLDRISVELERQVRYRLESTFERLQKHVPDAYLLLCAAAKYHRPVKEAFWWGQLAFRSRDAQAQRAAFNSLLDSSLLEQHWDSQNYRLFSLHNLVRSVALDHLSRLEQRESDRISLQNGTVPIEISLASQDLLDRLELEWETAIKLSPSQLSAYIAAIYWLIDFVEAHNASIQEQIERLLNACHHLCDAGTWNEAWKVLSIPLFDSNYRTLATQLDTRRLGTEQVALYSRLEGKLDRLADAHCAHGLGQGYFNSAEDRQPPNSEIQAVLETAIQKFRELNAIDQAGWTYLTLGIVDLYNLGDQQKAKASFEQAVAVFRQSNDEKGLAHTLHNLAEILNQQGQYEKARPLFEESLDILYNRLPEFEIVQAGWANLTYAKFLVEQGQTWDAQRHVCRAIRLFKEIPVRSGLFWSYVQLAGLLISSGHACRSKIVLRRLSAEHSNIEEIGHNNAIVHYNWGRYGLLVNDYRQALESFQRVLTIYNELGYMLGCCNGLEGAAHVAFQTNQHECSVRLFSVAHALRLEINVLASPHTNKRNEMVLRQMCDLLGESAHMEAWRAGQATSLNEALVIISNLT